MVLTPEQVKKKFREQGVTQKEWAEKNGFTQEQVCRVLNGQWKGVRGKGHAIAVKLGIKSQEAV